MTAQSIRANGINMAYRFDGPEGAPVVMLSNSLMSNHTMWDPQVPILTEAFRVLRYDTRGHGATDAPEGPYSIKLLAEDVVALLDALDIERVHFAGLSMGGMIGQYLGANHADHIQSLLLCDTASEMPTREMWNDRISMAQDQGIAALLDSTLKRWFTEPFLNNNKSSVEKVAEMIRTTGAQGYIACASAVRDMSQTAILSQINLPTIIIVGEDDPACTVEQSRILEQHIDGAELIILKEASHLSNIEQTDAFNTAMMKFLTTVAS
ncbi:MAG: 3-oxoadipate enol-lactonase [Hyphomicrobiaceae bacterium]